MLDTEFRAVTGDDACRISELAIRSKSHWDYTPEQMTVFRDELTMTADQLATRTAFGLAQDNELLGFYTIVKRDDGCAELEHLFIDPAYLRRGLGTQLLEHAILQCRAHGIQQMIVLSDPNAAGFYERQGAVLTKQIPSSIPGRSIPEFTFRFSDSAQTL